MYKLFGVIGLVIISYSVWQKNEKRQDILFTVGGISLLIYSISLKDFIFIILQIVFIASALIELVKLQKRK